VVEYPDLIIKRLPEAIKIHPEVKEELYTIISERYVTKIEIREILDEMRKEREEWTRRFEQQREEANRRFEQQEKEFRQLREEWNRQFEQQREESNRRFEQQRKELIQLREDTNARFEAIIHEMKEFRKEMREELQKTRKDLLTELEIRISTIGSRWGEFTEETLRNTLKRLLSERFKITKIEKWETEDEEGYVFNIPQKIEADFLLKDDIDYLIEISASANERDVASLFRKGEFYKKRTNKTPKLLFIAVNMHKKGKVLCDKLGIELITYDELRDKEE
jgi:hypothetical protein